MSVPSYKMFQTITVADVGGRYASDGVAASDTNTYYSDKFHIANDSIGFQLWSTGTLTGVFTLWLSDKDRPSEADDTDWVQATGPTFTQPAGSTTKAKYAVSDLKGYWYRVKYVNASGTGSIYGRSAGASDAR